MGLLQADRRRPRRQGLLHGQGKRLPADEVAPRPPCPAPSSRRTRTAFCISYQGGLSRRLPAAIDRKIARPGKNGARLQAIESADRMAEMRGVGIADVLRQMREVEILIGEMQQMPRTLPGAEGTERDSSLFLEQMQKARGGQSGLR